MNAAILSFGRSQECSIIDERLLETVRKRLLEAERTVNPFSLRQKQILDKLLDQLYPIYEKGFSFTEMSTLLRQSGIEISSETIERYFNLTQTKRIVKCEASLFNCQKQKIADGIARAKHIEVGLRQALKDGTGLKLHYQPQINMNTGKIFGAEALLRWDLDGESISPVEMIPVAEQTGLILPIGNWVLREACREAKRWQQLQIGGYQGIKMGVNLSVMQLSDDLTDTVHSALCDVGLPANLIGFEITESFLVANNASPVLHTLRDSGFHLSMDDFGTGYSCLSELKDLPLQTIKIDRSFVTDLAEGGTSVAIVETIIDLARKLGMETLAEGVETENQAIALKAMGCFMAQGFLYSKALAGNDFIDFAMNNQATLQ